MDDHIAVIHDHPAVAGEALFFALFSMPGADILDDGFGKGVDHAVAGASANNEIIGKGDDIFQVDQDDILALFIFQGIYDFAGKFECVQISPQLDFFNWAENNFV